MGNTEAPIKTPLGGGARQAMEDNRAAKLELQLSDARRDLAIAIDERNGHMGTADVFRALAAEAECSLLRANRNALNVKYQLRAAGLDGQIADLRARVAALEMAASGKALPVVPVDLDIQAGRDMEETMSFAGYAA